MWDHSNVLSLLSDYKLLPELWDSKSMGYKQRESKREAYIALSDKYGCPVEEIKDKIKSLRTVFRREYSKVEKSLESGQTPYRSNWFAYDALLFILSSDTADASLEESTRCEDGQGNIYADASHAVLGIKADVVSAASRITDQVEEQPTPRFPERLHQRVAKKFNRIHPYHNEAPFAPIPVKYVVRDRDNSSVRDEFTIFGEYVSCKLRKLNDEHAQSISQHLINNIIFNAEMGKYNRNNYKASVAREDVAATLSFSMPSPST